MSMAISWIAARKDWRRLLRDPWKLTMWIGIPAMIGGLMSMVMGGQSGDVKPRAVLYLEDQDDSMLSGLLVGAFSNEQVGEMVDVIRIPHEEAVERLNDNDGSAALLIPEGFEDKVMADEPVTLTFVTNPAQRILPGILEEVLSMLQQGVFYIHRVFGEELELLRNSIEGTNDFTVTDPEVANIAVQINSAMRSLEEYLNPVLIKLEFPAEAVAEEVDGEVVEKKKTKLPVSFYMLPSILLMALFFIAQGLSEDLWEEREAGTMKRFLNAPHSVGAFLMSKMVGAAGVYLALGIILFSLGIAYFDFMSWSVLPLATLWWTAGGVGVFLLMGILQMIAGSRRGGSLITNLLMFPLLMIGGSFFPFEAMPEWMVVVGGYTPNGWILQELKPILLSEVELGHLGISLAGLLVGCVVLYLALQARVRRIALGS